MVWGLLGAFAAAIGYGIASALQALAARRAATVEGLDPRLLARLARSWQYLLGLVLDGVSFLLSIVALRSLPLFVVQAIVASFLAVTAVLGAVVLKTPLRPSDRVGVGVVVLGLVLVASSATEDRSVDASNAELWGVLVVAILLAVLAVPLARVHGAADAAVLGGLAGLAYAVVAVAARVLPNPLTVTEVLRSPATYGLVVAGAIALLAYPIALQRGSVTQATAPLVVAETVVPGVVGVLMLGDRSRSGWEWVAVVGFVLAVVGAVSLARHGELSVEDNDHEVRQ
jgi:drug/metabolite transporter (DMT)-like permease